MIRRPALTLARRLAAALRVHRGPPSWTPAGGGTDSTDSCSYRWWRMPMCVLVPVYNAPDEVGRCIDALLAHTPRTVDILIIDDASTEPAIGELLAAAAREPNVRVVRNQENLGFTRTVNLGLALVADRDVVLLNSDTEVGPRWLTYLAAAAYARDDIGTATAVSNSASQFSVPLRFHNTLPYWLDAAAYARAVAQCNRRIWMAVPFGHGFCLYVKRRYIEAVGLLDDDAFPRGYGEEIDFCLRGTRSGWRHALATKAFVYHVNAASFGVSKTARKRQARASLDRRYPEYGSQLRLLSRDQAIVDLRRRTAGLWRRVGPVTPRRLWVLAADPAIDPEALSGLPPAPSGEELALAAIGQELRLYRLAGGVPELTEHGRVSQAPTPFSPYGEGYEEVVGRWLLEYAIESVEILGLRGHGAGLVRLAADLQIPVSVLIDDTYAICPSGALTDEQGRPCGGRCTPPSGECLPAKDPLGRKLKHEHLPAWQDAYRLALTRADRLAVSSYALLQQLREVFPELAERAILVSDSDPGHALSEVEGVTAGSKPPAVRVGVLCHASTGMGERELHYRVLAPLTHPVLRERLAVEVSTFDADEIHELAVDLIIVPGALRLAPDTLEHLLARVARSGVPFVVDVGCHRIASPAPPRTGSGQDPLYRLLEAAAEIWTDESELAGVPSALEDKCVQVPTCIDTRLWPASRDRVEPGSDDPLRLLFRASAEDKAALDFAIDAVQYLRNRIDRPVELVVTGRPSRAPKHPWVRFLKAPHEAKASYPVLAAWLAQKGPYHLGLLPPGTCDPCPMTTILEYAGLGVTVIASIDEAQFHAFDDLAPIQIVLPSLGAWSETILTYSRASTDSSEIDTRALAKLLAKRGGTVTARILASRLEAML